MKLACSPLNWITLFCGLTWPVVLAGTVVWGEEPISAAALPGSGAVTEAVTSLAPVARPAIDKATEASAAHSNRPWQLMPYKTQLTFRLDPRLPVSVRSEFSHQARRQVQRALGALIELLPAESTPGGSFVDKEFLIHVEYQFPRYLLELQEHDLLTQTKSQVQSTTVNRVQDLPAEVTRLVEAVFRPVARIHLAAGGEVKALLRGALLAPPHAPSQQIAPGSLWGVYSRAEAFSGAVRVTPVPWTIVETQAVEGALLRGKPHAVSMSALNPRRSARSSLLLIKAPAPGGSTRLRLVDQEAPHGPLASYEVQIRLPTETTVRTVGTTDANGEITLSGEPGQFLIVFVKHGQAMLSRFPLIPGVEPKLEVKTKNDDPRLAVEGYLLGIQDQIVDLTAQRELVLTRAKLAIERDKLTESEDLLKKYRLLPAPSSILQAVDRHEAVTLKKVADNKLARQLRRMYQDTRVLINRSFSPKRAAEVEAELRGKSKQVEKSAKAEPSEE